MGEEEGGEGLIQDGLPDLTHEVQIVAEIMQGGEGRESHFIRQE